MPDIHWIFEGKGLEFCFDEEILTAIFFQFIAEDAWNVGSWSGPLIDGFVAPDITPEQADATFGEPEAIGCGSPTWRRYEIGDHFIHFDFREEGLHMITLLLETPLSPGKPPTRRQLCTSALVSTRISVACMQQPWNTGSAPLKAPPIREGHS